MTTDTLLQMRGIVKGFPGVQALAGVDFDVRRGEVHALVGHNGAGKSTLIKILTGAYPKDGGHITLQGRRSPSIRPAAAQAAGIATIYQEVNLVPYLTRAGEHLPGPRAARALGPVDWARMRREAGELLAGLGVRVDLGVPVMQLSVALAADGGPGARRLAAGRRWW